MSTLPFKALKQPLRKLNGYGRAPIKSLYKTDDRPHLAWGLRFAHPWVSRISVYVTQDRVVIFKKQDENQHNNTPSSDTPVSRSEGAPLIC